MKEGNRERGRRGRTHPNAVPIVKPSAWLGHAIHAMLEAPPKGHANMQVRTYLAGSQLLRRWMKMKRLELEVLPEPSGQPKRNGVKLLVVWRLMLSTPSMAQL